MSSVGQNETEITFDGVYIPNEVLRELDNPASYRILLPHGGEALARSNCNYHPEK